MYIGNSYVQKFLFSITRKLFGLDSNTDFAFIQYYIPILEFENINYIFYKPCFFQEDIFFSLKTQVKFFSISG